MTGNKEITLHLEEEGSLYTPTLFNLFVKGKDNFDKESSPIVKLSPKIRVGQDGSEAYLWVTDRYLSENIEQSNRKFDEDNYPLEIMLQLNNQEIRHLHAFLGAILKDKRKFN